jgi:hypothetical protein
MAKLKKKRSISKKRRSALGRRSRTKGATYELVVAQRLREVFPNARRGIGQARSGGDVPDVEGCEPWWAQTKHGVRPNISAALEQARRDMVAFSARAGDSRYKRPVAIVRANRSNDIASMYLSDFIDLLKELSQCHQNLKARTSPADSGNGQTVGSMAAGSGPGTSQSATDTAESATENAARPTPSE